MTLLTGLSITLASLLFSSGLSLIGSIQDPFDKLFNKLNASHIVMLYDQNMNNSKAFIDWFYKQKETESVTTSSPYYLCNGPLLHKGKKIDLMIQLTEFTNHNLIQDKLLIIEGNTKIKPAHCEIWIPKYLANNYQISIGDTIGIPGPTGLYQVVVSAIIADPHYGSGMINPTRAWIATGELPFFIPVTQLSNTMLGIRVKNPESVSLIWERFNRKFNYTGVNLPYSLFKNAYMGIYQILGSVVLIFSIMALVIAIYMVRIAITSAIYDDYKLIGIYKSIGFKPINIKVLYLLQYTLLSLICIPLGLTGTFFIIRALIESVSQRLGTFEKVDSFNVTLYLIPLVIVGGLVLLFTFLKSLKVAKINPATAIRTGAPPKKKFGFLLPNNIAKTTLPLPVAMGLRLLSANFLKSCSQALIMMISIFIMIFSINISYSFEKLKYNKTAWGFENGDIQLNRKEGIVISLTHDQLMETLMREKNIKQITSFSYTGLTVLGKNDLPILEINGKAYADSISHTGLTNINGRHPSTTNEISLCIGTARQLRKQPGDSVSVFIEGQKKNFVITGIYQDVSNMGQGFRLLSATMKMLNPMYSPFMYSITVFDNSNLKEYNNYLLKKLGETVAIVPSIEDRIVQMGIITSMKNILFMLSFYFLLIMLISIISDILISTKENQKLFGILKSIGWTPKQTRLAIVWKITYIGIISMIISIPIAIAASPILMGQVTGGIGLLRFPYQIDFIGITIIIPLTLILISAISWRLSSGVTYINARKLINA
jgi:putative ABC transport system permease protein